MIRCVLGLAMLVLVTACGVKGDLERPQPLWNREEAIRRQCREQIERNQPVDARCSQYQTGVPAPQ